MKILIAAALAALAAQTPALSGPPTNQQFAWARTALERQMIDYPSARFRDVHADRRHICGFVNGKNRLGAYAGWKRFVVMGVEDGVATVEGSEDFPGMISLLCDGENAPPARHDFSDRIIHR